MEKIVEVSINGAKKRLEQSILNYNEYAVDFKFDYEVKGNFIFAIGYSRVIMKQGDAAIYRMTCIDIYDGEVFKDGNVIDYGKMYTVEDVISRTKGYFNHYAKKLSNI